jgi:hypothetical protein
VGRYKRVWNCERSFVKPASFTIIACETEEKVRIQQKYRTEDFLRRVARLFIRTSHLTRTVPQVYDHVQLEVKRIGGNCDLREAGSSRQEVRDRTGEL